MALECTVIIIQSASKHNATTQLQQQQLIKARKHFFGRLMDRSNSCHLFSGDCVG